MSSPRLVRGPDPSQRSSLANLNRGAARARIAAETLTRTSQEAWAANLLSALVRAGWPDRRSVRRPAVVQHLVAVAQGREVNVLAIAGALRSGVGEHLLDEVVDPGRLTHRETAER
jgi:hypothetical protein